MDNIEDILRVLTEDDENSDNCDNKAESEQSEGLFSGLDPEMLLRLFALMETLNQPDDNERFLLALRPLLREENRPKIDSAVRLLKLFTLLPFIKESGFLEKLI